MCPFLTTRKGKLGKGKVKVEAGKERRSVTNSFIHGHGFLLGTKIIFSLLCSGVEGSPMGLVVVRIFRMEGIDWGEKSWGIPQQMLPVQKAQSN